MECKSKRIRRIEASACGVAEALRVVYYVVTRSASTATATTAAAPLVVRASRSDAETASRLWQECHILIAFCMPWAEQEQEG